jgi:hypothetical protein
MKALLLTLVLAAAACGLVPAPAHAAINVERKSSENPVVEVFKSTAYGALAGLVLGAGIAWASHKDNSDAPSIGFLVGAVGGCAWGIYDATHRPKPVAMIDVSEGKAHLNLPLPSPSSVGMRVDLVSVRF